MENKLLMDEENLESTGEANKIKSNKKPLNSKKNGGKSMPRQKCEVYSRVVGYLRPVNQWNDGKQAEFDDRKEFEDPAK